MKFKNKAGALFLASILAITSVVPGLALSKYTVKSGDVLSKIALSNGTTWQELAKINNLVNPDLIFPGQEIKLEESKEIVEEKDTKVDNKNTTDQLEENQFVVTILNTTDTHGNIMGYTYEDDVADNRGGLTRVATYVNQVRAENPNTLVIDNGDTIQGNILTDDVVIPDMDSPNPIIEAFNYIGYDAMVLGNHEYNFGLDVLDKITKEADFPMLNANTYKDGERMSEAYTILESGGAKIATIGIGNPNILKWDGDKLEGVTITGVGKEVQAQVEYINANENVDAIVVAAHLGRTSEFYDGTNADAGLEAIEVAPETALLILGHDHSEYVQKVGNTQVVGLKDQARAVGRTDIVFEKDGDKNKIVDVKTQIVPMEGVTPDPKLVEMMTPIHEKTRSFIKGGGNGAEEGEVVAIAYASENFQPKNEINGIPEGKLQDTAVMDLINNIQLKVTGADVSAAALFKDTSDLPEGALTYGNIFDIYKFANTIYKVEISGSELKNYMEWSAKHYNQAVEGDISVSFNPDVPGYLYDMFQGVNYKVDISKPVGERIVDLTFKGKPVTDEMTLTLAINNYRFSGLTSEGIISKPPMWTSPLSVRDYIKAYMEEQGTISPIVDNNWEIIGIDFNHPDRDRIIAEVNKQLEGQNTTDERHEKVNYYNKAINVNTFGK